MNFDGDLNVSQTLSFSKRVECLTATMAEPLNLFAPRPAASTLHTIPCPSPGCDRWFCNRGGLTKHMRARHRIAPLRQPERPNPAPRSLDDGLAQEDFDVPLGEDVPVTEVVDRSEWEHHPLLCGTVLLSIFSTEALKGCLSQQRHVTKPGNIFHGTRCRHHLQSSLQMIGRRIMIARILN